mgnify:CR=1 FL=1
MELKLSLNAPVMIHYKDDLMKILANFYLCYDYKYDSNLREFVRIESPEGYLLSP